MKSTKFIIYNGRLIYGTVQFHSELIDLYLITADFDKSKIKGGGRYCVHDKTNTVFFLWRISILW